MRLLQDTVAILAIARIGSALQDLAPITPDTQSCELTENVLFNTINDHIGESFIFFKCSDIEDAISAKGIAVTSFECQDDGNGDTQLQFNIPALFDFSGSINDALRNLFPAVNSFNCPGF